MDSRADRGAAAASGAAAAQGAAVGGETRCSAARAGGPGTSRGTRIRRLTDIALYSALALVLSWLESMIPLPVAIPGVKLGLANVAVLVAFFALDARGALATAVVKVVASGLLFGSPTMLAYSLGGTALAYVGMLVLTRVRGISAVLVSMVAAILHNTGQLAVAALALSSPSVFLTLPVLAVAALVTGALSGAVATGVLACMPAEGGGRPTVDITMLEVHPGEHVVLVGRNGSGKTTCALELAGLAGPNLCQESHSTRNLCQESHPTRNLCQESHPTRNLCQEFHFVRSASAAPPNEQNGIPDTGGGESRAGAAPSDEQNAIPDTGRGESQVAGELQRGRESGGESGVEPPAVGMAFQDPDSQIVAPVVADDVAFGLANRAMPPADMPPVVRSALARSGAAGLEGREVETLSGGQRQRVCMAGLLALGPSLVIFDETTSMLDAPSRAAFARTVRELAESGMAVVTITQIADEAFAADRIAVVSDAAVIWQGTPGELLRRPDVVSAAGIEYPPVARLALELRDAGYDVPLTNDEHELREVLACSRSKR